jgi:hypothetical protein
MTAMAKKDRNKQISRNCESRSWVRTSMPKNASNVSHIQLPRTPKYHKEKDNFGAPNLLPCTPSSGLQPTLVMPLGTFTKRPLAECSSHNLHKLGIMCAFTLHPNGVEQTQLVSSGWLQQVEPVFCMFKQVIP